MLYNPVISAYSQDKHGKPQNKHLPTFTDVGMGSTQGTWLQHRTSCQDAIQNNRLKPYLVENGLSKSK